MSVEETDYASMEKDQLIELLVSAKKELESKSEVDGGQVDALENEVFSLKAQYETAEQKISHYEGETKSLLSRAMEAEQKNVELSDLRDKLTVELEMLQSKLEDQSSNADGGKVKELQEKIEKQMKEITDLAALAKTVEEEKQKAKEHNELRLSVEHAFNELSKQHEDLMQQLEDAQRRAREAEVRATQSQEKLSECQQKLNTAEMALISASDEKDALQKQIAALQKKLKEEADRTAEANARALEWEQRFIQMKTEAEAAKEREAKTNQEFAALKKKAAGWKRDAERCMVLESKVENLEAQVQAQEQELKSLKTSLKSYMAELRRYEEEEEKRKKEEAIKSTKNDFLKQQLAELQLKYANFNEREKSWLKEREELLLTIKKLKWELRNKNPSQLKMMEIEVQNQLLLGMLQHKSVLDSATSGKKSSKAGKGATTEARYGGSTTPAPRKLPQLKMDDDSPAERRKSIPKAASQPKAPIEGTQDETAVPEQTSAKQDEVVAVNEKEEDVKEAPTEAETRGDAEEQPKVEPTETKAEPTETKEEPTEPKEEPTEIELDEEEEMEVDAEDI